MAEVFFSGRRNLFLKKIGKNLLSKLMSETFFLDYKKPYFEKFYLKEIGGKTQKWLTFILHQTIIGK